MKTRVAFFADHDWSLGRLAREFAKYAWQYGVNVQLISWNYERNNNNLHYLLDTVDYFISSSGGTQWLMRTSNIPANRCIEVLYHESDLEKLLFSNPLTNEEIANLAGLASWSKSIINTAKSMSHRISREVKFIRLGYNSHNFYDEPSKELRTLGFASGWHTREETERGIRSGSNEPWVRKRGYLAKESALECGLHFNVAQHSTSTGITMPAWYKSVDAVSCPSIDQGAGGPVFEGGLAGKLILTTNAGDFDDYITEAGAHALPIDEKGFLEESIRLLNYYKNNPSAYRERCFSIREYALKKYDWHNFIPMWLDLFKGKE